MAKKRKSRKKIAEETLPPPKEPLLSREVKGVLTLLSTILYGLGLFSFSSGQEMQNLLGLLGYSLGWLFHFLFGFASYLFVPYFFWIGWRLMLSKKIDDAYLKTSYFTLLITSVCLLLNLTEDSYPHLRTLSLYLQNSHIGGAPFYYLYRDLPHVNLLRILNHTGIIVVFSCFLLTSCMLLLKIRISPIILRIKNFIYDNNTSSNSQNHDYSNNSSININSNNPPQEENAIEENSPVKNLLRFVKLRTCNTPSNSDKFDNSLDLDSNTKTEEENKHLENSQQLLAITPELDLTSRPSLSKKEQKDEPSFPPPFSLNSELETEFQQEPFPTDSTPPLSPSSPSLLNKNTKEQPFTTLESRSSTPSPFIPHPDRFNYDEDHSSQKNTPPKTNTPPKKTYRCANGDFQNYVIPSSSNLTAAKKIDQPALKKNLRQQAEVLEETLSSFGIDAKVGQINCGPRITSFEVHPSIGVKVQKIKALTNDIALNLEAPSIRIIAPIPGKAAVGIEVPNPQSQEVSFKDLLEKFLKQKSSFQIPILLGQDVCGESIVSDLAKMPHCIIAGATGSGKSVCINTIVMSILMTAKPDKVRLLMIDPKKVELTPYSKLPHMLAPVITEAHEACTALKWLVKEMEDRYELLKNLGVRNILAFNERKIDEEAEAILEEQTKKDIPKFLPYIVGIIDELADLMMVASSDIETPIARIAQMARAVGIHLILATQRPSREVITGIIKANFPTRISFKVASRVNSQIVLDEIGAESLLGNGDMLFLPPGSSQLLRTQGAFIRDEDIQNVINKIEKQAPPDYTIESFNSLDLQSIDEKGKGGDSSGDALYNQARDIVIGTGNASTTFLQRKLKIGYARAASIMDQLEENQIVGPAEGSRARRVLVASEEE